MSTIYVSVNGLSKLEKYIADYVDETKRKCERFVKLLSEKGVEIAKTQIADLDAVFTGELMDSISSEKMESDPNKIIFCVKASSEHALFVEFGTGVVGKNSPHPNKSFSIAYPYAIGEKIFKTKDGKYGWIYYNEQYGKYLFTEGMPSRPFMYNTTLELQKLVLETAREVFGE